MRHQRLAASAIVIGTTAAALAGCGGGSKGLAKADLDTKANAICKSVNDQINAVPQPSSIQDATAAAAYFDKVLPLAQAGTKQLQDLKPASDVKSAWNAFVAAQVAETNALASVRDKADKKDPSGLTDLSTVLPPLAKTVTTTADAVGANDCDSN